MADTTPAAPVAPAAPALASAAPVVAAPPAPVAPAPVPADAAVPSPILADETPAPKGAAPADKDKTTAPEPEIEVKLPKGVDADTILLGEFKPLAKEMGLKSEGAQKLVDFHLKAINSLLEKSRSNWEQQQKAWFDEVKADKEFGGKVFEQTLKTVKAAVDRFGDPALKEFFKSSGYGSHPALVRFVTRVGKAIAEDSVAGTSSPTTSADPEARARTFFPTMFKE